MIAYSGGQKHTTTTTTHHADPEDVVRVKVSIFVVELLQLVHQDGHQHPPDDDQYSSGGRAGERTSINKYK